MLQLIWNPGDAFQEPETLHMRPPLWYSGARSSAAAQLATVGSSSSTALYFASHLTIIIDNRPFQNVT